MVWVINLTRGSVPAINYKILRCTEDCALPSQTDLPTDDVRRKREKVSGRRAPRRWTVCDKKSCCWQQGRGLDRRDTEKIPVG